MIIAACIFASYVLCYYVSVYLGVCYLSGSTLDNVDTELTRADWRFIYGMALFGPLNIVVLLVIQWEEAHSGKNHKQ